MKIFNSNSISITDLLWGISFKVYILWGIQGLQKAIIRQDFGNGKDYEQNIINDIKTHYFIFLFYKSP